MFTVQLEGGRERERQREERDGKKRAQKGAYTRGRVWPGLPGPASCQRHGQSAPASARRGWDHGGGDQIGGEGRGLRTLELKAAEAGNGHERLS